MSTALTAANLGITVKVSSDLVITQSDVKAIQIAIDSDMVVMKSDVAAVKSDLVVLQTSIDSDVVVLKSDIVVVQSDLKSLSFTSQADYTASGAIAEGDLVGVTAGGLAAKITPDWAATAVPTTFTTLVTGGAATTQSHSAWIATDKFITIVNNNANIYMVVSTIASDGTITVGTPVDSTFNSTANTNPVRVCKLDTDKAIAFYISAEHSNYGYAFVITVSGTVPTAADHAQWTANEVPTSMDCCQLGTDKCCASYKITGAVYHHINGCTVSGTTQTWGTAADSGDTSTAAAGQSSLCKVATDLVAWFYERTGNVSVANVSFSGANPTRNGTDITAILIGTLANANGELTSCSPMANVAFVATVDSSATFVYTNTVTVSGTASPVAGVGTNITFEPNPGNNISNVSSQVLDSTHVAIQCIESSNSISYMGIIEVASVNLVRILNVGRVAVGTISANTISTLLIQTNGKSIEIVNKYGTNLIVARPYTIYYKGLSTYADTVPTPVYGFLGVALANISDAATGSIGLKGTFTGYASGLNVLKKYVRGTNEYTSVKTVNKDYPYGEVLATVMSATSLEVMIPPGNSVDTAGYMGFEYQPSLSGNGPWLVLTIVAVDTFTAWTSYLIPHNTDLFVKGMTWATASAPAGALMDVVQIGYGSTTVNVTLLESIPVGITYKTDVGYLAALTFALDNLRVPAGQTLYMRTCRYAGNVTTMTVNVALTLAQLE